MAANSIQATDRRQVGSGEGRRMPHLRLPQFAPHLDFPVELTNESREALVPRTGVTPQRPAPQTPAPGR